MKKKKIKNLQEENPRFRRVFSEFEGISNEIREIEMGNSASVPDDFLSALQLQKIYLEKEIDEWLGIDEGENTQ